MVTELGSLSGVCYLDPLAQSLPCLVSSPPPRLLKALTQQFVVSSDTQIHFCLCPAGGL